MTSDDFARLARNLKTARKARGISQTAAGEAVGMSRQTIVNWENPANAAEPSTDELATLAQLYGVGARELRFADLEARPAAPRDPVSQPSTVVPHVHDARVVLEDEVGKGKRGGTA